MKFPQFKELFNFLFKKKNVNNILFPEPQGNVFFQDAPLFAEKVDAIENAKKDKTNVEDFIKNPIHNPLEPYFKDFNGYFDANKEDHAPAANYSEKIKKYSSENRPFTPEQYEEIFHQLINLKNFMHQDKAPILKKLWEDAKLINDALEPIKKMGLNYTLDLTGGSVRDFILGKHHEIKDLDFMVSLTFGNLCFAKNGKININDYFSKEELDVVNWGNRDDVEKQKINLLRLCMNRTKQVEKHYFFEDDRFLPVAENSYGNIQNTKDRLVGVVKLSGKDSHYPMDLLLTDYNKVQFIKEFDFDICKASFALVNKFYEKDFPKDYSHLISRFSAEIDFFADVYNKKFTYNCENKAKSQINRSLGDHLARLKNKYPDYELNLTGKNAYNYDHAKTHVWAQKLTEELNQNKENEKKIKKVKI